MSSQQVKYEQASQSMAAAPQSNCVDPLDSLIDFSEYETVPYQQSPSISPSQSKTQFSRPVSKTPSALPASSQPQLSGPSHNYDLYKQQTGIPQGAVASTLAVNEQNAHISQYGFSSEYLSGLSPNDDFVDFGSQPRRTPYSQSDMDMEYGSPEPAYFYPEQNASFVNPNAIGGQDLSVPTVLPTQTSNVGRLWPGMHQQQAALAKAQAQQKQQQQIIQQQRQNAMNAQRPQPQQQQRPRGSHQPADPIVEEKISQLLNSMRQSSVATDDELHAQNQHALAQVHKMRKDEEDMDEDERLLASEEGKKLSSKERRQLRNKVSARAFRSRRKEYISQLEGEIAVKVNENTDLRTQNRALMEENTRLSDLTRMLLSSPSFSGFLDTLSQNPAAVQQSAPAPAPQPQVERQVRKDVNPYAHGQMQQHIGMTMVPEQTMDFSMLDINADGGYSYQPQVFSVLSMPETIIDASILSGKASNVVPSFISTEKVELPTIERAPIVEEVPAVAAPVADEEFDNDPAFALFADNAAPAQSTLEFTASLWSGIPSEKESQFTLVTVSNDDVETTMTRVQRLCSSIDDATARLEALTMDL
ncbi:hypothetical protein BP5796_04165 [Coleophoma crateriformis]|uniref:BZIP domain-containing protein n=1 Tax=Coleophoma crateriformis TaxID=565419 RepID=A0A3D8SHP3_9HELO|nr:hypothetical protein BP5796_04165 [Coleophoma crateriformis]